MNVNESDVALPRDVRYAIYEAERELERTRCSECGEFVRVGDWPFCPHGRGHSAIRPDDVPGGFWVENGFEQPTKFYSHSEHEAALAARGLEIRAKHAGDHDKIMSNWAAGIDAGTLENARALVSRTKKITTADAFGDFEPVPITVTDVEYRK